MASSAAPAPAARLTCRTWSWYPDPVTVSVYSPGVGRSGRVNRPTGPDVTVVAVRVVLTSPDRPVMVTDMPPRPPSRPSWSCPDTRPVTAATPVRRVRSAVAVPPAPRVISADSVPNPWAAADTRYVPGVDRPVTLHDPGVPSAPGDTEDVWTDTRPSVIVTVAAPTGPSGPVTVPDIAPSPATSATRIGSAPVSVAPFTMNRWVWYPARASVSR